MSLLIAAPDVEAMARRLAEAREVNVTEALRQVLRREVARLDGGEDERDRRVRELQAEVAAQPLLQEWGDEQMYDEHGLPR